MPSHREDLLPGLDPEIKLVDMPQYEDMPVAYGFMLGDNPETADYAHITVGTDRSALAMLGKDQGVAAFVHPPEIADAYAYCRGPMGWPNFAKAADFPESGRLKPNFAVEAARRQDRYALFARGVDGSLELAVAGLANATLLFPGLSRHITSVPDMPEYPDMPTVFGFRTKNDFALITLESAGLSEVQNKAAEVGTIRVEGDYEPGQLAYGAGSMDEDSFRDMVDDTTRDWQPDYSRPEIGEKYALVPRGGLVEARRVVGLVANTLLVS